MSALSWRRFGDGNVIIKNGKPCFPKETKNARAITPGIYRLSLTNGYAYIGETKNLSQRFGNYCSPTQGTEQEHILCYALIESGGAIVEVITNDNMVDKSFRLAQEKMAKQEARTNGIKLLNQSELDNRYYLHLRIKYHEEMLTKTRTQLVD